MFWLVLVQADRCYQVDSFHKTKKEAFERILDLESKGIHTNLSKISKKKVSSLLIETKV